MPLSVKCPEHGEGVIISKNEGFSKVFYCAYCETEVAREGLPKKPTSIIDFRVQSSNRIFSSLLELREAGLGRESDSVVCSVEWEDGASTIEHLNDVESLIKVNKWITPIIPDRYLASSKRYWQSHYPTRHVYALKLSEDVWKSDHSPAFPIVIGGEEFGKRIEPGEERGRLYIGETGYRFEDGKTGVERRFDVHMDPGGKYRAKVVNEHPFSRIFSDCLRDDLVFECQDGNYALGKKLSVKVECWVGWKLNMSGYAIWGPAKTDMEKYRHLGTDGWT